MEAVIFALIGTRNGYTQHETFVPESPAELSLQTALSTANPSGNA